MTEPGARLSRRDMVIVFLLLALSAVPYLPAIKYGYFQADDFAALNLVRQMRPADLFHAGFYRRFENFSFIRPVGLVIWRLNYLLYGPEPAGYHITNVMLHAACSVLVFLFARRLSGSRAAGALAGMLFALHPAHAEPVNWLSCRYDLAATASYLTALLLYMDWSSGRGGAGRYVASLAAGALAIFSKEMAVTLPAVLAVYALFYRREGEKAAAALLWTTPFFGLAALYFYLRFAIFHGLAGYAGMHVVPSPHDVGFRLVKYFKALLFGTNLAFPYHAAAFQAAILSVAAAGVFSFAARGGKKDKKDAAFLTLFLFMTFLPVVGFSDLEANYLINARYLYLSSVVSSALLAQVILPGPGARPALKALAAVGAAVVLICHGATLAHSARYWTDSSDMASRVLEQFREEHPGTLDGLDITVYNLPPVVYGWKGNTAPIFARALLFCYGYPAGVNFRLDTRDAGPGEAISYAKTPGRGLRRRLVVRYDEGSWRLITLYDGAG